MKKLYESATIRYSDWSTTRYSPNGKAWICGSCNGNHIGVAEYSSGKPYWAEYILPGGNSSYWEESRTVNAKYETQYHYRNWISGYTRKQKLFLLIFGILPRRPLGENTVLGKF